MSKAPLALSENELRVLHYATIYIEDRIRDLESGRSTPEYTKTELPKKRLELATLETALGKIHQANCTEGDLYGF